MSEDNLNFFEHNNDTESNFHIDCTKIREKWFTNLTDIAIPKDLVDIISLVEKFNFKCELEKHDYFDLLKSIQISIHNLNNSPENSSDKI